MSNKKPNPTFSPTIQALLDLKECGFEVDGLLKSVQNDNANRQKADKLFDQHQYPDKALKYTKYYNFNQCRADMELSASAIKILLLFIKDMPENSFVSVSSEYIQKLTHLSKPTIIKAMRELIENGFIALMSIPTNKHAPIYMINPNVANTGKPTSEMQRNIFEDLVLENDPKGLPLYRFMEMNCIMDNITIEHCKYIDPVEGKIIKYNSYREVANKEKSSQVVATHEQSNDDTPF